MTCDLMMEWLDDYLDDQLDPQNRAKFEEHLAQCKECQALVEDLISMKEVMLGMPMMALPTDFNETLHEKLLVAAQELKFEEKSNVNRNKKILQFPFNSKKTIQLVGAAAAIVIVVASGAQLKNSFWWNQTANDQATYEMANTGNGELFGAPQDGSGAVADQAVGNEALAKTMAPPATTASNTNADAAAVTAAPAPTGTPAAQDVNAMAGRDIIKTGNISIKVANFEKFYAAVQANMTLVGGYVESSYSGMTPYYDNNKVIGNQLTGSVVLRIPSKEFAAVFESVKKMGTVESSQSNIQDITMQLSDLKASIHNLVVRETRLQELMKMAKNVTEVMQVERELSAVRTQIDQLESSLKIQSNQVSLSTLYINVQESPEVGSEFQKIDGNLFERAKQALIKNINSGIRLFEMLFVAIVAWLPVIAIVGILALIIPKSKTYKKWRNRK